MKGWNGKSVNCSMTKSENCEESSLDLKEMVGNDLSGAVHTVGNCNSHIDFCIMDEIALDGIRLSRNCK